MTRLRQPRAGLAAVTTRSVKGNSLLTFEGLNDRSSKWSYNILGNRCPNKGEFFVSGAIPQAWKARQHLTTEYWVVEPVQEFVQRMQWVPKPDYGSAS